MKIKNTHNKDNRNNRDNRLQGVNNLSIKK